MPECNISNAVHRAALILKAFSAGEFELDGADLVRRTGIPKTTGNRILRTLAEEGLIEKNEYTGKYSIGYMLYALGNVFVSRPDLVAAAQPVMKMLNKVTREVVNVNVRYEGNIMVLLREESRSSIGWRVRIGSVFPAYATSDGKALLGELTERELDNLYPQENLPIITSKTIRTKTALKLELEQIRKTGVAFHVEENFEGVFGVASVIRDASGKSVAAMSTGMPLYRLNEAKREMLIDSVKTGTGVISCRLGYYGGNYDVRTISELNSWINQREMISKQTSLV